MNETQIIQVVDEDKSAQPSTGQVQPIEVKWNIPAWMLTTPVAPHMQESPAELD